jgi:hypothetical protein
VQIPEYLHTFLHSFTFVVLDGKGIEYKIDFKIKYFHEAPGWRNWQTQRTQNPPTFGSWGFDSPSRHQPKGPQNKRLAGASSPHEMHSAADAADLTSYI